MTNLTGIKIETIAIVLRMNYKLILKTLMTMNLTTSHLEEKQLLILKTLMTMNLTSHLEEISLIANFMSHWIDRFRFKLIYILIKFKSPQNYVNFIIWGGKIVKSPELIQ